MLDNLYIIAYAGCNADGPGISGGDRIFIEIARFWIEKAKAVNIFVGKEGQLLCWANGLDNAEYVVCDSWLKKCWFPVRYIERIIRGCITALKIDIPDSKNTLVYSSSDFLPDSLPGFILRKRFKYITWIAGFYLFAPNPLSEDFPYKGKNILNGICYYLLQRPIYCLVKKYADIVFVTSEPDVEKFITKKRGKDKTIVVKGGVDAALPDLVKGPEKKTYDVVFMGRLHPQKGVTELIDICKFVCKVKNDFSLALIGDGYLERSVQKRITEYGLGGNIHLLGGKYGLDKIKVFKASRIVVHPAIYDSGGMSACEAMACGLPGVSFDLEALKTYYPKGMLKTRCFDLQEFADNIIKLLSDTDLYNRLSKEALDLVREEWDWDVRVKEIYNHILKALD